LKSLKSILTNLQNIEIIGNADISINGIHFDSRKIENGFLFVAVSGTETDGHQFINKAIENGATAVICNRSHNQTYKVPILKVDDTSKAMGEIAAEFYGNPSKKLKLIGVTGTNGKTTVATLLYRLFRQFGQKVGLLSTVKNYINEHASETTHTTPDVLTFNRLLNEMVDEGCEYCFAEVSSHSVVQKRIHGLEFVGGIFTNLTHDHLDYHKTFAEYIKAKKMFFDNLPATAFALTNIDDKNGNIVLQNTKARKQTYALRSFADFNAKIIESHFDGTLLTVENREMWTSLVGRFNAYNLLAVFAAAKLLGKETDEILTKLSGLKAVHGRFEAIKIAGIIVVVDYAHTPDALLNVLKTINEIRIEGQNIITVAGAGGNRDKTKRPLMAQIAADNSQKLILTSDNPRNEIPENIIDEMYCGLDIMQRKKTLKITDRREAIKTACMLATNGDIILIAGKGHETYQEINGVKTHFDDKEEVVSQLGIKN
jgi:UDP-N-acetylmuramoyl-L-alanyl-D-glutamate--2,6-diaminopimelate ligase